MSEQEYISATPLDGINDIINSPEEFRRKLMDTMSALIEGRVSVSQANAVSALSAEVHKSINSQWDMACYAIEHLPQSPALGKIEQNDE